MTPALFCLDVKGQELGQAVLELELPEPNEERLVLKGRCFCSIPRGGWKGCVELILPILVTLYKNATF